MCLNSVSYIDNNFSSTIEISLVGEIESYKLDVYGLKKVSSELFCINFIPFFTLKNSRGLSAAVASKFSISLFGN